jgi:hypothetical protein
MNLTESKIRLAFIFQLVIIEMKNEGGAEEGI